MLRNILCLSGLQLAIFAVGCGSDGPISPKIDRSQARKDFRLRIEDIRFPTDFPGEITLLKPTHIYQQSDPEEGVVWDTSVSPTEFRDYYVAEFKRLGLEPEVSVPQGMLGENYEIQAYDKKVGKWHCVAVGKRDVGNQVSCFLLCKAVDSSVANASKEDCPPDSNQPNSSDPVKSGSGSN